MSSSMKSLMGLAAAVGIMVFASFSGVRAQQQSEEMPMHGQHGQMAGSAMMDDCKAMMNDRQQMKSEMESAQAALDALVTEMNAAEGDAKTDAVAKVVTELAAQRKSMMSRMMAMQPQMMQHMMGHMRMAMQEGNASSMACPMMKEMGDHEKGPSSH